MRVVCPSAHTGADNTYQSRRMAGSCCRSTNTARCANAPTRQPRQPPPPPVDATLTRIDYDLRIENDDRRRPRAADHRRPARRLDARADSRRPDGARRALDGQPVSLVEGPPPHVLLSRAGRVVLTLDIVVPLTVVRRHASRLRCRHRRRRSRASLLALPTQRRRPVGRRRLRRRARGDSRRKPVDVVRPAEPAADAVVETEGRRSPRRTAAAHARAGHRRWSGSAKTSAGRRGRARRSPAGRSRARSSLAIPPGLAVNQVNGATVGDWDGRQRHAARAAARSGRPRKHRSSFRATRARRATASSPCRSCACRPPSAKPAASPSMSSAPAKSPSAQARGLEPADPSELGDIVAGRESPSMIAFRLRPLAGSDAAIARVNVVRYTPQAVLIANVEEARYRALASEDGRLLVEARYAVRNNQRSFLKVDAAGRRRRCGARRSAGGRFVPASPKRDAVLLPLEKGRAGEEAPTFVVEIVVSAADRQRGSTRARRARAAGARSSGVAHRRRAASTRRAFASSCSRARFASKTIPVRSPRRFDAPRTRRHRAAATRHARTSGDAGDAACRRSSIASETKPADARSSARCRCT